MEIDWAHGFERSMYVRDLEPDTTWMLGQILPDANVFWDVGANIGFYSLFAASIMKLGEVVAFEPCPCTVQRLSRNIEMNRLDNVSILELALGQQAGSVPMYAPDPLNPELNSLFGDSRITSLTEVRMNSADSLIISGFPEPDVIKVDIEGCEVDFLLGARRLIETRRPKMIVEISRRTLEMAGRTPEELVEIVRDMGYQVFWLWRRQVIEINKQEFPHELLDGRNHGGNYFLAPTPTAL